MINKLVPSLEAALAGIRDGATVLCSGFGGVGEPQELMNALIDQCARDLVVVANNAGVGDEGLAGLIKAGRVRKIICNYPRTRDPHCIYTNLSVLDVTDGGLLVREIVEGLDAAGLQNRTEAPLAFAPDCRVLTAPPLPDRAKP